MREQLQELVDRWHARGIPSILWVLEELKRILATEPQAPSVKAGWVPVTEPPTHTRTVYVAAFDKVILGKYCPLRCKFCFVDSLAVIPGVTHWHAIEYPQPPEVPAQ